METRIARLDCGLGIDHSGGVQADYSLPLLRSSNSVRTMSHSANADETSLIDASVVLLTHYIPLYQVRVFQELAKRVRHLKILLSTPIEPNRDFELDWGGLDVSVQKCLMLRRRWKHQVGFNDEHYLHLPYDTLSTLRKINPDVVLSHELGPRSLVASVHRSLHRKSRLILLTYMSEHTEAGRSRTRMMLRRRLLKRADAVTYNGPSCRRYLLRNGVDEARLFPLPYAADDRVFNVSEVSRPHKDARGRFVCVGQLNQRKGVRLMLEQLAGYCRERQNRQLDLTFVGNGPEKDAIKQVSLPENLTVNYISNLSPAKLKELYKSSGAAIHPTLADEWLMVVNESLHCGLPIIGSRYAQAMETVVKDGENGWVFDPLVPGDLSKKLDAYFAMSDDEFTEMRSRAVESVRERTPGWAAAGAVNAIRSVLGKREH